jgi:hypothetical protein
MTTNDPSPPLPADEFPSLADAAKLVISKKGKRQKAGPAGTATPTSMKPVSTAISSPIRPLGSKRTANESPTLSPARTNDAINAVNRGGVGTALTPQVLERKLARLEEMKAITADDARTVTMEDGWIGERFLTVDAGLDFACKSPNLPDGWLYNFDDTAIAPLTEHLTHSMNMERIVEVCAQRALKKENPADSPYHYSNSPFGLEIASGNKVNVLTKEGKVAGAFSRNAYGLGIPADFKVDMQCPATYEIMCRAKAPKLFNKLRQLRKKSALFEFLLAPENGPIHMNVSKSKDRVLVHTPTGMVASFAFSPAVTVDNTTLTHAADIINKDVVPMECDGGPEGSDDKAAQLEWLTKGKGGVKFGENTVRNFNANTNIAQSNRFAPLTENFPAGSPGKAPEAVQSPPSTKQSRRGKKDKKTKPSPATTVDDLTSEQLDAILSEEEESAAASDTKVDGDSANSETDEDYDPEEESVEAGDDEESELTDMDATEDVDQVGLPKGKEGVRISTRTSGGSGADTTTTAESTVDDVLKGAAFGNSADEHAWVDEIELSDDELEPEGKEIKDVVVPPTPTICASEETSQSELSAITDPSYIIPPGSDVHIVQCTIHLAPNERHTKTLVRKSKCILDYLRNISEDVAILARSNSPSGTQLPPLTDSKDSHYPTDYGTIQRYFNVSQKYILEQPAIDARTLENRRKTKEHNYTSKKDRQGPSGKRANLTKKAKGFDFDHGPCELWFTFSISTKYPNVEDMLVGLNIDLGSDIGLRSSLKNVQCFESRAKYMLTCVNSNLCAVGVRSILQRSLFREQRRLCMRSKLDSTEYYDRPVPEFTVYTKAIRPLKGIPEGERGNLTFDTYPAYTRMAFHIEAAESAWDLLDVLLEEYATSGRIGEDFGPAAYLLESPHPAHPVGLTTVRNYHEVGRISCGWNLRTTVMECPHVSQWFHPVKVRMAEVDELNPEDGKPTGKKIVPDRPYERTSLAKELSNITINGVQVFHSFVVSQVGPDAGASSVVVSCDPECPYTPAIRQFAQNTLTDLNCFIYHHLSKNMGYCDSTVQRLVNCCYMSSAALAEESTWDASIQKATPRFQDRRQQWMLRHRKYDYKTGSSGGEGKSADNGTPMLGNSPVEMSDEVRLELVKKLKCNPTKTAADAMDDDGHASALTGMPDKSVNTLATEGNEVNQAKKQKDMAIALSLEKRKRAEIEKKAHDEMEALRAQIEQLKSQQVTPHHSGSGTSPLSQREDEGVEGRRA